jgi:hypothetical protein
MEENNMELRNPGNNQYEIKKAHCAEGIIRPFLENMFMNSA